MMKTLTVRQPWAQLIAEGVKTVENRTWHTKYRGTLAIHAGQQFDQQALLDPVAGAAFVDDDRVRKLEIPLLPRGAIIAIAELHDVHSYQECFMECSLWAQEPAIHWVLRDIRKLSEPLEWPGSLGLRLLSPETESLVRARVTG